MHENALVTHLQHGYLGQVRRAPDGDRPGAFYRNDSTSFYVVWEWGNCTRCGRLTSFPPVPSAPCPACPEPGWVPSEHIARSQ